jgi:hypothetical protein
MNEPTSRPNPGAKLTLRTGTALRTKSRPKINSVTLVQRPG